MADEKKKQVVKPSVFGIMAAKFNLAPDVFLNTIKATVMKPGRDGKVPSNEEIAAFLVVANKYNLDPFTNEIYAFPAKKGGIIPIVGVDGFVTIMNRQKGFNGYEMAYDEEDITMDGAKSCPKWAEVKIYHKDREHPTIVREYLDEVYVPARGNFSGPWQTHTKRMLRHKVLIQAIRVGFGITGIYDPDEGERILDAQVIEDKTAGKPDVALPQPIEKEAPEKTEKKPDNSYKAMLEKFAMAKKVLGEKKYYEILGRNGYEKSNQIPKVAEGNKILDELRKEAEGK